MTEAQVDAVPASANEVDRQSVIRKAYSRATTDLRTKYTDEFHTLVAGYAKEDGVDWSPRPTAKDKARAEMEKILSEFPDLAQ